MSFLIISILLSTVFPSVYSAALITGVVPTLNFNSEAYEGLFLYAESKGINSDDLKQNLIGVDGNIIEEIIYNKSIHVFIREIITNTVKILKIPTHDLVQYKLSEEEFEKLNTLIIDVITTHYKVAFAAKDLGNDYDKPPFGYEASMAIIKYNYFINRSDCLRKCG